MGGNKHKKKKKGSKIPQDSEEEQAGPSQEKEEPEESKKRSDSIASTDSVSSVNYIIAPETREASGILKIPVVGIRLERSDSPNESKLILKIGDERPATTILKGQGHHISAYVLYRETMINRINGEDVESVADLLCKFIAEYIESPDVLEKFTTYLSLDKNKNQIDYDKETRKAIYDAESKTRDFLKRELPPELQSLPPSEKIQEFLAQFQKLQEA